MFVSKNNLYRIFSNKHPYRLLSVQFIWASKDCKFVQNKNVSYQRFCHGTFSLKNDKLSASVSLLANMVAFYMLIGNSVFVR